MKFVKASIIRESPDLLLLSYHTDSNQKDDDELFIGESIRGVIQDLKSLDRN